MKSSLARSGRLLLAFVFACAAEIAVAQVPPPPPNQPPPNQPAPAAAQNEPFKPEEIEALVAPIALYPDDLLSQVLMASTYPLEVVQAARWVKANPNVKGDAAVKAVENQSWDVSVKSLVAFPQILEPMDQKLDWTQKLGDAFLADQKSVLDAVQRLRTRAEKSGNLKTNEQQKVIVEQAAPEQTVIKIEPANPQTIYVPAYNPTVVYGGWAYPGYPPYYWPPSPYYYPGGALMAGFAWGVGIAAAGAIFGGVGWGHGDVNINVNKAANIDRNFDRTKVGGGGNWEHNPSHRQGVAYRDNKSRERYGQGVGGADSRRDYRGREGGAGDRGGREAGAGDRGGRGGGERPTTADRGGRTDRGTGGAQAGTRDNSFQGVGGGSASQRDFDRGRSSNQSLGASRGGSGASRGGGGGGGARGGGGGGRGGGGGGRR